MVRREQRPWPSPFTGLINKPLTQALLFCLARRGKNTLNSTLNRLNTHELLYDEVHLKNDKSVLFENCYAVIDGSPALLEKVELLGKVRTGLSHPWNKESGHPLFRNLNEVYCYIKNGSL